MVETPESSRSALRSTAHGQGLSTGVVAEQPDEDRPVTAS
jgi:hypothetical protein